jgi:primosomal protein N' (replication factor Y)
MPEQSPIYRVAVPSPLYSHFDYLPPAQSREKLVPGARVRVPFGRRAVIGIVLAAADRAAVAREKLRRIERVLDEQPVLPQKLLALLAWAAEYYHHPIGEVLAAALPQWLRAGRPGEAPGVEVWRAAPGADPGALKRAPAQRRVLEALMAASDGLEAETLAALTPRWRAATGPLERRGFVARTQRPCLPPYREPAEPGPTLNEDQRAAVEAIVAGFDSYGCFLLHGVTGSGKTEVYLAAARAALARGRQVLVLVPEIGLTPQLVARFERRLGLRVAVLHSGLGDAARYCAWRQAAEARTAVVLGTRSAVFTPMPDLGLIVVDEEHDPSYKQQDGFRYSARDLAVLRAARERIPVVLGSATPSLESVRNAREGGYRLLGLPERTGVAALPAVRLLDMRRLAADEGLSHPLRTAIAERLARGEQSLLFLNRRGFAPAWLCRDCGRVAVCHRCDARLTYHHARRRLICHHCGAEERPPEACPACGAREARALGEGTERIEAALAKVFPKARVVRIDRDVTRRQGALEEQLARVHAGEADILVGTQMLSKGHDFPNVTLVGVVNADQGLYSADFRAPERLMQQILQVAGRAGRADKPGEVLVQTWHPGHPLFTALVNHDYESFLSYALSERRDTGFPPYSFLALLRAESPKNGTALEFLRAARASAGAPAGVEIMEPAPAPMEKRAGRWRAQLLVQSTSRKPLHAFLDRWVPALTALRQARQVRWSLDVDPGDMY